MQAGQQAFPAAPTRDLRVRGILSESFTDAAKSGDDRPLDGVAVVERAITPSTRYTIHLRLDSGVEQFISVAAPPGGLLLEVRDMTGDSVRNDLVLRPALVRGPLNVLLNDGEDHFTLATSDRLADSWESDGKQVSGTHGLEEAAALASSRSDTGGLAQAGPLFFPQLRLALFSPIAQTPAARPGHAACAGRAPPPCTTQIS